MTAQEYMLEAEKLQPKLAHEAMSYLHNKEDAEDIAQDVLAKLWNILADLHSPMAPLAHVLTRNLCIDHIRRSPNLAQLDGATGQQIANNAIDASSASRTQGEMIDRMMRSIEQLPPKQQLVLRLRHMDGMSTAEIAQLTGNSEAAIRQTLCRARQGVRNLYIKASKNE